MKSELRKRLASVLPCVNIEIVWSPETEIDESIFEAGNALEKERFEDWFCWQTEARATAIVNGELVTGSECLGGTWERSGDNPEETNPTISGYETDLVIEALHELNAELFSEKYRGTVRTRTAIAYALQKIEKWKTEEPLFGSASITGNENA